MRRLALRVTTIVLAAAMLGSAPTAPAELVIRGATVYTVDAASRRASAFAVRDGAFVAVGSDADMARFIGPHTIVRDARGATIVPGFIDAHAHLYGIGEFARNVDLRGLPSYEAVIAAVKERAAKTAAGTWIYGRAWDQNRWAIKEFPTHDALDAAVPDHPIVLTRVDGHAVLANAQAMRAAGIDATTQDPPGGRIVRDATGAPTGVFVDNAKALVVAHEPEPSAAEMTETIATGIAVSRRAGVVELQDMGAPRAIIERYDELGARKALGIRVYAMVGDDPASLAWAYARGPKSALYDGRLWVRGIKMYADGALGSRGAAMLAPYTDDPGNVGLLISTREHLRDGAIAALKAGFQISTHAIGDRGNRNVLDAYEAALQKVPVVDPRLRIEHAQVVAPEDIPRFKKLGVLPSMQATHATSDMAWAQTRLGPERMRGAYAWQTFLRGGAIVPNGTDAPVEGIDPLHTFYSAITRQDENGMPVGGWRPSERMTRDQALRSMTIWGAYAGFQERDGGSIERGKRADFVVLDRDIMTVPAREVLRTRVTATYIDGSAS